jgi:biopolymer transport protein ExbD
MRPVGRFHKYRTRLRHETRIPTESMADIAFLLMIFFITTTVLRLEEGLHVDLPRAVSTLRQPNEDIVHVWIDADGRPMIDDLLVGYEDLGPILARKLRDNPRLIVALNADRHVRYSFMHRALAEMKRAEAVRVSFTALPRPAGS